MDNPTSPRLNAIKKAQEILSQNPVYLDTETTGLDNKAEIVEIAIVDHDANILINSLVKPSQPIPASVMEIHHITNDMVQKEKAWLTLWPTIRGFLYGKTIAIYNADFDLRMMQQSHACYRQAWKENFNLFCIMKLYAQFRGEWDSRRSTWKYFKLEQAGKDCGISLPNSHRAKDDTLLAHALLHHIANAT